LSGLRRNPGSFGWVFPSVRQSKNDEKSCNWSSRIKVLPGRRGIYEN
jgi:hypothetical protein